MPHSKRIGFVDYRLENYHANTFLNAIREPIKDRGWTMAGCWGMEEAEGRQWAGKKDVPYFAAPAELDEQVDGYMILAPSNPEVHLELCQKFLPFGKPTYVDKTFAPDLATAQRIFDLADEHGAAVQTASVLRYTDVQKVVEQVGRDQVRHMAAWGGGRSFGEYAIHPVELVISCMGPQAMRLMRRGSGEQGQLLIDFSEGRDAVVNVYCGTKTSFAAAITTAAETRYVPIESSRMFIDAAARILDFLEAGRPMIDRRETLMIRRILDAAEDPAAVERFVELEDNRRKK